jgi:hypothetical protein
MAARRLLHQIIDPGARWGAWCEDRLSRDWQETKLAGRRVGLLTRKGSAARSNKTRVTAPTAPLEPDRRTLLARLTGVARVTGAARVSGVARVTGVARDGAAMPAAATANDEPTDQG